MDNVLPFVDGSSRVEVIANMKAAPLAVPTKPPPAAETKPTTKTAPKRIKSRKGG